MAAWIWGIGIRRFIDRLRRNRALQPLPQDRRDLIVSAEDQVLVGRGVRGSCRSVGPPLAGAACRRSSNGPRWPHNKRSCAAARHTDRNDQDADDAGSGSTPRGALMTWHVDTAVLRAYSDGTIDLPQRFSLEAHLLSCSDCRTTVVGFTDRAARQLNLGCDRCRGSGPRNRWARTWPRSLGRRGPQRWPDRGQHLPCVAPRPSSASAVLPLAVVVANSAANGYVFFSLAVAPLLSLAGIAAAYGPGFNPTYEVGVAAPLRGFKLLLIKIRRRPHRDDGARWYRRGCFSRGWIGE